MVKIDFKKLILFEDEQLIIISKPAQISTLDDRNDPTNLLDEARKYLSGIQVCHRLDKSTSGVLILAKNEQSYRYISGLFQNRQVNKTYHAIVNGVHHFSQLDVNSPITVTNQSKAKIDHRNGKPSHTIFQSIKAYRRHTLVSCQPVSGRLHQIRVHLASLNAPIVGDSFYGGKDLLLSDIKKNYNLKKDTIEQPLIKRVALHASGIEFLNPDGQKISINADYPKDFQAVIRQFEKFS